MAGIQIFKMFKVKCEKVPNGNNTTSILDIPLPNKGIQIDKINDLPNEYISTIFCHTCHLLDSLSTLFNIPLLHPLYAFETYDAVVSSIGDQRYN
jgi:hypothetical protein